MLTGMNFIEWSCDVRWDHVWEIFLYPFVDGIVGAFASVWPRIFDVVIISVIVKGGLVDVIGHGRQKNRIALCELHQYLF